MSIEYAQCGSYLLPIPKSAHRNVVIITLENELHLIPIVYWSTKIDDKSIASIAQRLNRPLLISMQIADERAIYRRTPAVTASDIFRVELEDNQKSVRREAVVAIMPEMHSQAAGGRE
jgi:hypothetical protein